MIAPDTSVVIAALAPWHAAHTVARDALGKASHRRLIAHVGFEVTSSLSRMPRGQRVAPDVVWSALDGMFPSEWLQLDAVAVRKALAGAVGAGIRGGALYDALIASTALSHGAHLLTFDRRGLLTYDALGVAAEVLSV